MSGCAVIQYKPPKGKPEQALAELAELVDSAGAQGAELIVCPEMASTGYLWSGLEQIVPYAEDPVGPTFQSLSPLAQKHQSWIVCGYIERDPFSKSQINAAHPALYNSALIISPQGQLIHSYRKVLLYEADLSWAQPGKKRVLIDTEMGTLFPLICMDLNDPMFSLQLLDCNPSVIPFCTNWLDESSEILSYWKMRLRGWKGWFLAANTWGTECLNLRSSIEEQDVAFRGESVILNPEGRVMAQASSRGNCVLYSSWDGRE